MLPDLVVTGARVVSSQNGAPVVAPASIHITAGTISAVAGPNDYPLAALRIDAGNAVVLPGLVDSHVHINEPGRTEWEGFATATAAAAAGGVTTLVDMPLNSIPPTTTLAGLEAKQQAALGNVFVDVGFWGGVVAENAADLPALIDAGVCGFKCFLIESGVEEFSHVDETHLRPAMDITGEAGVPLLVHAELAGPIDAAERAIATSSRFRYLTYLASRPRSAEDEAIALMIKLASDTRAPVHIVHTASATSLPLLEAARNEGVPITAETCPHYLHFAAEDIADGATQFKCAPPIREEENRGVLWEGLTGGVLDMVVSDHSPCIPSLKQIGDGDFMQAWGGVSSLGLALPVMWTEMSGRGYDVRDIATWLSARPAALAGLRRKGRIAVGADADLVFFDPAASGRLESSELRFRNRHCPYLGETLRGRVDLTMQRGRVIYRDGALVGDAGGTLLKR